MSCTLIFSGISSIVGSYKNLPVLIFASTSTHLYLLRGALASEVETTSKSLDFGRNAITSPGLTAKDGMFTV